jgi:hypothetical protein
MRNNLQRLVWIILIAAFAVFCMLLVGIPLSVRSYLFGATIAMPATVEAISGTVLVQGPGERAATGISIDPARQDVPRLREMRAGSLVTTDSSSRAILTFHRSAPSGDDVVLGTVQLYNNTRAHITQSDSPRYGMSPNPDRIILRIDAGLTRIATARYDKLAPTVEVITPHCQVTLSEGSYSVRVNDELSEVVVRFGEALVQGSDKTLALVNGQRTEVGADGSPRGVMSAAQNLIVNGNFTEPLAPAWQTDTFQSNATSTVGKAEVVTTGGRKAVFFSRMGENGVHSEVGISQVINRDVLDFESVTLRMDIKLLYQSLSGGGYLSSEFPVMVRIDYKDIYGIDRFWTHGFYYQNTDSYSIQQDVWGRPGGEQIPHAVWFPYESENLLTALGDVRPARIHSIRIYASGWNFQSIASEVELVVR